MITTFIYLNPRIVHHHVGRLFLFLCCLCFVFSAISAHAQGQSTNPLDHAAMVWVPGGSFTMGSSLNGDMVSAGQTQQVTLSGYWLYTNEVTVAQYLAFCSAQNYALPPWPGPSGYTWAGKSGWTDPSIQQDPIVNVTWADAQAYATWAGVSLPTEAQYEYAARGPQENNYPWGGTATVLDPDNDWNINNCASCVQLGRPGHLHLAGGQLPGGGELVRGHGYVGERVGVVRGLVWE